MSGKSPVCPQITNAIKECGRWRGNEWNSLRENVLVEIVLKSKVYRCSDDGIRAIPSTNVRVINAYRPANRIRHATKVPLQRRFAPIDTQSPRTVVLN